MTPVATTIAQNEHNIDLGVQRDRGEVDYRWTPSPDWDVNIDYSNEHRYGVQEQGFLFSDSTSTPMAQVAAPVDDTTQDASISAEYFGYSPWGMRWNGILRYDASIYTDRLYGLHRGESLWWAGQPRQQPPTCRGLPGGVGYHDAELLWSRARGDAAEQSIQQHHGDGRHRSALVQEQPVHGNVRIQCHDGECAVHTHDDQS